MAGKFSSNKYSQADYQKFDCYKAVERDKNRLSSKKDGIKRDTRDQLRKASGAEAKAAAETRGEERLAHCERENDKLNLKLSLIRDLVDHFGLTASSSGLPHKICGTWKEEVLNTEFERYAPGSSIASQRGKASWKYGSPQDVIISWWTQGEQAWREEQARRVFPQTGYVASQAAAPQAFAQFPQIGYGGAPDPQLLHSQAPYDGSQMGLLASMRGSIAARQGAPVAPLVPQGWDYSAGTAPYDTQGQASGSQMPPSSHYQGQDQNQYHQNQYQLAKRLAARKGYRALKWATVG
ncbi:hypothetical protein MNV49_002983 [Pseudohyphozyma bogoriensis]|nr:hypothetical protein MNV49_002983 [Pseudohyphozyma bogoriensis]